MRTSTPPVAPNRPAEAAPPSPTEDGRRGCAKTRALLGIALFLSVLLAPGLAAQDAFAPLRDRMVEEQIRSRNIDQPDVLNAMKTVPRHLFVPPANQYEAYGDNPVPIGWNQTISQPYVVALMTQLLDLDSDDKVLEIGTGSGYHAAVLSRVAGKVFTIEIIDDLGRQAKDSLKALGFDNVEVRIGDGYKGWPEEAPFDAVILTAAPPVIPARLIEQLKVGGKMVVPVGGSYLQDLEVITKTAEGREVRRIIPVRFVPMTGEIQENASRD